MGDATGPEQTAREKRASRSAYILDKLRTPQGFSYKLRELLEGADRSIEELAADLKTDPVIVREYFKGRQLPDFVTLQQLLPLLGVSQSDMQPWMVARLRVAVEEVSFPASGTANAEQVARRELSEAERELTDADELTLPALWKATHARLDYYHQIATGQARQSFRNAQIAMGVGFVLLVVFAVLVLYAQTTAAAVVAGTLGATSAAFAAYISRTFVRSQETAAAHLRSYFDQPLEFSRYLAAERLLNGIEKLEPEQRAAITTDVLRGIVPNTPSPDKPDAAKNGT